MKISIKTIFSLLILAVVYISVAELNTTSNIHHEVAIESTVISEPSQSEPIPETLLLSNELIYSMQHKERPTSESHFISFNLTQDIFRPPLLT